MPIFQLPYQWFFSLKFLSLTTGFIYYFILLFTGHCFFFYLFNVFFMVLFRYCYSSVNIFSMSSFFLVLLILFRSDIAFLTLPTIFSSSLILLIFLHYIIIFPIFFLDLSRQWQNALHLYDCSMSFNFSRIYAY